MFISFFFGNYIVKLDPKIKDNVIILDASNSPISDAVMKQPSGNETTFQSPIIPRKLTDVFSEQVQTDI
jgi:hypothetical protein